MKFSEKMWLKIISKVTKYQDFTLSLEDTFFGKQQGMGGGGEGGVKLAFLELKVLLIKKITRNFICKIKRNTKITFS